MNLNYIYLLLIFLYSIIGSTQEAFNFRYDYGLIQSVGLIIDETDHAYVTIGRGFKNEGTFEKIVFFNEIDKKTGISKNNSLHREEKFMYLQGSNSSAYYKDKIYVPINIKDSLHLATYDLNDKTVTFSKPYFYRDTLSGNSIFNYGMKQQGQFAYILHVFIEENTGSHREIIITKYNLETGAFSHTKITNEEYDLTGVSLHLKPNGNIVIFGHDHINRIYLVEIDTHGNKLWEYFSDYTLDLGLTLGGVALNNEFFGLAANRYSPNGKSIPVIIGFNAKTKEIEWVNDFGFTFDIIESYYYNIIPAHNDSAFVYVGEVFEYFEPQDSLILHGRIGKVDRDGNAIWSRNYSAYDDSVHSSSTIWDIAATSDGHYITAGKSNHRKIFNDKPETLIQSWVLKIDEDGHIVPTDSVSNVSFGGHNIDDKISIFPNPASDQLIINQDDLSNVTYRIHTMDGRLVDQMHIRNPNHSTVWNISDWNTGTYIIQIVADGHVYKSEKVVKL